MRLVLLCCVQLATAEWRANSTVGFSPRRRTQVLDFSGGGLSDGGGVGAGDTGAASSPAPGKALDFSARDGKLWANNKLFHVKGINWYGSEGRTGAPTGLHKHSIDWYVDLLADNGFNALRLLFNHESVLADGPIETLDVRFSPQLYGMTYLEMFAEIADRAARRGLLVMMACHRLNPTAWPGDGKWYDRTITEQKVMQSWDKVARKLCSRWNVFAVDLQNEPHASSWAKNSATDWNKARASP